MIESALRRTLTEGGTGWYPATSPLLSDEEERALAKQITAGSLEARDRLVAANFRLVLSIARQYRPPDGMSLEDIIQEGLTGLMIAIGKFTPGRGRFSTCATFWIRQTIGRAIENQGRLIRLPTGAHHQLQRAKKRAAVLRAELNREPTTAELATAQKLTLERLKELLAADQQPLSLDGYVNDEALGFLTLIASDEPGPDELALRIKPDDLDRLLWCLNPRERYIIERHYGLHDQCPVSQADIAREKGLSRERVRTIHNKAIKKIQMSMGLASGT